MKTLYVLSLLLPTLMACQKEDLVEPAQQEDLVAADSDVQTWQLVKLRTSWPVLNYTGADLPWQETYVLQADSTFRKRRQQGDQVTEAGGTFTVRRGTGGRYLDLTYEGENHFLESLRSSLFLSNCMGEPKETLVLEADKQTFLSSSEECDGPRLTYQKVVRK